MHVTLSRLKQPGTLQQTLIWLYSHHPLLLTLCCVCLHKGSGRRRRDLAADFDRQLPSGFIASDLKQRLNRLVRCVHTSEECTVGSETFVWFRQVRGHAQSLPGPVICTCSGCMDILLARLS